MSSATDGGSAVLASVSGNLEPSKGELNPQEKTGFEAYRRATYESLKKGLRWLWKDMRKQHLLWVKIIFLFQSASLITLYPYLTIHMRSLGFTIEDTAIVNTAVPLADIVESLSRTWSQGPPAAGLLADKLGNFRIFMGVITLLNGAASLLLLFIPPVTPKHEYVCLAREEAQSPIPGVMCPDELFLIAENATNFNDSCGPEKIRCVKEIPVSQSQWMTSFSLYMAARVILDILRASSLMLFEGAVAAIIKEQGGDYGLQKLFGTAGAVVFGPLAGKLIDLASSRAAASNSQGGNYLGVFILYFILRFLTAGLILKLTLDFKPPAKKVFKNIGKIIVKLEVLSFLLALMMAGALWGFLETYLFWFMEDLGASKFLMGISLAMGTLAGVPISIFSRLIITRAGHHFIIMLTLTLYVVRLLGYSWLTIPEPALLLEVLKPFCTSLLFISAMNFIKDVAPITTIASLEGVFGALYFGVGRGLGGLAGGYLWYALGAQDTFRAFAALAFGSAGAYGLVTCIRTSRIQEEVSIDKESQKV